MFIRGSLRVRVQIGGDRMTYDKLRLPFKTAVDWPWREFSRRPSCTESKIQPVTKPSSRSIAVAGCRIHVRLHTRCRPFRDVINHRQSPHKKKQLSQPQFFRVLQIATKAVSSFNRRLLLPVFVATCISKMSYGRTVVLRMF